MLGQICLKNTGGNFHKKHIEKSTISKSDLQQKFKILGVCPISTLLYLENGKSLKSVGILHKENFIRNKEKIIKIGNIENTVFSTLYRVHSDWNKT
jgi:hypothetical protein